ncbi:uncharacterized protein Z518_10283 [Rhinocladiella mackenziei CBS 650.93]|uniref:Uncharacterized protein n=1 Tax=Rhinocladiella mackenziei CBS 650.93 TaxID=1442369 RepID=A0A0D2IA74_9EURO|nr:uncharacterized protein Z518_10283 [Rhinocladiella mackenziei CBS 650.93]KIX00146.1 hypothetical protein Z518_10283 [Rhinocladiella mackenziei CBS 650.93]
MLAARDQENLIHAQHTTAAAKPLSQNLRTLHSKTPGNFKTPFRPARHDENRPLDFKGQKTVGKDGPSKLGKNTFVTPQASRNRAPLGAKTTNAKAYALQTPAPAPLTTKPGRTGQKPSTAHRSGRSKITIATSEPVDTDVLKKREEEDEPDFGYAPPPPVELPDPPFEFSHNSLLPPLTEEELTRGYGELYSNSPQDENGMSLRLKEEEEEYLQYQKEQDQKILDSLNNLPLPTTEELNQQVDAMIAAGPMKNRPHVSLVDTMKARSAAVALAEPQSRPPSAATRPTRAFEQKKKGILPTMSSKPSTGPPAPSTRPLPAAVSKNTIGFPKAKKPPSIIPKVGHDERTGGTSATKPAKIDQASIHPKDFRDLYGSPPVESDMWFRLKQHELLEEDISKGDENDVADELFEADFFPFENSKLDDDDFQLPMPE